MTAAAALPASFVRPAAARIAPVTGRTAGAAHAPAAALAVASIGHLVPRSPWTGRVHSVFARACNVACGELLLTIGVRAGGDGPTTIVLGRAAGDLRDRFAVGERVDSRAGCIRSARVALDVADARVWRPAARAARVVDACLAARLRGVRERLAARRTLQPSVLDREAADVVTVFARACAELDLAQATASLDRLLGWGEGLTPAGDDCIVGVLAALDALAHDDAARRSHRDALGAAVAARSERTTAIAAHALRLAAAGHFAAPVDRFVAALCTGDDDHAAAAALHDLLGLGATSGADTASGVVAALDACSGASATEAA